MKNLLDNFQVRNQESLDRFFNRLLDKHIISVNGIEYSILEAELYFHSPDHPDETVITRDRKAGDIYFHQYGFDLSFASRISDEGEIYEYGGILIRSICRNKDKAPFFGPQNCKLEVLNQIKWGQLDIILKAGKALSGQIHKHPRKLGKTRNNSQKDRPYRYIKESPEAPIPDKYRKYAEL